MAAAADRSLPLKLRSISGEEKESTQTMKSPGLRPGLQFRGPLPWTLKGISAMYTIPTNPRISKLLAAQIPDLDVIELMAREVLRQRESSPTLTALLAKCLIVVLRDLRAVQS
jgi:hypothetical protein